MDYLQAIDEQFPIRKTRAQKDAFLTWGRKSAAALGYTARVEPLGKHGQHRNLVIGDVSAAEVVFTAHYDTPANMVLPNLMLPRNLPLFLLYQVGMVALLMAFGLMAALAMQALTGSARAAQVTFLAVYFGLLLLMLLGPANRHNRNDNTSGVATIFRLMERMPRGQREKAAFILFDNEEKGKLGSSAYAKEHVRAGYTAVVVNLDCVGVGEHVLTIASALARKTEAYGRLCQALRSGGGYEVHHFPSLGSAMNSDQKSFKCGIGICACRRARGVGFYTPYIHTRRDTAGRVENIDFLAEGLAGMWADEPETPAEGDAPCA